MILEEKLQGVEKAIEGFYEAKQIAPRLVESILYSVHAGETDSTFALIGVVGGLSCSNP